MSSEAVDSEDDKFPDDSNIEELVKGLPQASDKINVILDRVLSTFPTKYSTDLSIY
jgi:hypothetical protein